MRTRVLDERNRTVGEYPATGPVSIPDDAVRIAVYISRANWTDITVRLEARLEISLDGGITWPHVMTVGGVGGSIPTLDPVLRTLTGPAMGYTAIKSSLPIGSNRLARVTLSVPDRNVRTHVELETL